MALECLFSSDNELYTFSAFYIPIYPPSIYSSNDFNGLSSERLNTPVYFSHQKLQKEDKKNHLLTFFQSRSPARPAGIRSYINKVLNTIVSSPQTVFTWFKIVHCFQEAILGCNWKQFENLTRIVAHPSVAVKLSATMFSQGHWNPTIWFYNFLL